MLGSCQSTVDLELERQLLLESNEIQRTAHMENDASMLVSQIADEMTSVQFGDITLSSVSNVEQRFTNYFKTVKYSKWDDLEDPHITISPDGQLATMLVKKIIETAPVIGDSTGSFSSTQFAWGSLYKKVGGQWKIYANISTRVISEN